MFRFEFLTDDKNVPKVLWAISGLALGVPVCVPMTNAVVKGGKVVAVTDGSLLSQFQQHLTTEKVSSVDVAYIREFLKGLGRTPGSAGYLTKQAQAAGIIKKTGSGKHSRYNVMTTKKGRK